MKWRWTDQNNDALGNITHKIGGHEKGLCECARVSDNASCLGLDERVKECSSTVGNQGNSPWGIQ